MNTKRKHNFNQDFFEVIDNEEKAYFLGLLFADGYISKTSTKGFGIQLQERDVTILNEFKKVINSDYDLFFINRIDENHSNMYRLFCYSNKTVKDLEDKGCIANKSLILKFPTFEQVPRTLIHHFIRGYFDGDGCI